MYYYVISFIVFILDQLTKFAIVKTIKLHDTVPVIGNFFELTSYRNRGAAFSILQNQRWFFLIITFLIMIALVWYIHKMMLLGKKLLPMGLALVLGGALGNFFDRLLFGEVVDFLQFNFRFSFFGLEVDYTYPIFNLADSAVVIGAGLVILDTLIDWRNQRKGAGADGHSEADSGR